MKITLSEEQIENQILLFLESKRIFAWKNPTSGYFDTRRRVFRKHKSRFAINGVTDIIGIHNGKAFFIEVKAKKGIVSDDQERFIDNIQKGGAIAFVARSVEDVYRCLKDNGILND